MESSDTFVDKVLEIDPQVDLDYDTPPEDIIRKGPVDKTIYAIGASNFTNSNLGFQNISPASLTTVTDRNFKVKYDLLVTVKFPATDRNDQAVATPSVYYPYTNAIVDANFNGGVMDRTWGAGDDYEPGTLAL